MNKLQELNNLGFSIQWKTILIGIQGGKGIPPQLVTEDVLDYLHGLLEYEHEQADNIISLILLDHNTVDIQKEVEVLSENDGSDYELQWRKWRAYMLHEVLLDISQDCLQGLLALMEFWTFIGVDKDCPHIFPQKEGELSVGCYFTDSMYKTLLQRNHEWLIEEISLIKNSESNKKPGGGSLS